MRRSALLPLVLASTCVAACRCAPAAAPPADDAAALSRLVAFAGEHDTDALVVLRDGKVLSETWYRGEPRRLRAWSITKSVTALAVLQLVAEGRIRSLDEPVATWFPEFRGTEKERVTLRHVLTHSSGLRESWEGSDGDHVRFAANAPLDAVPGTRFLYSNVAVNLLTGIVEQVSGERLDRFVDGHLFAPLGIRDYEWTKDRVGHPDAMGGLWFAPAELAKVGELLRLHGRWGDRQLLPPALVDEALAPSATNPYLGLLWWRSGEGFAAAGMLGQHLIVLPAAKVVIVRMREGDPTHYEESARFEIANDLGRLGMELAERRP